MIKETLECLEPSEELKTLTVRDLTDFICTRSKVRVQSLKSGSELFKGLVLNVPEYLLNQEVYNVYSGNYEIIINI